MWAVVNVKNVDGFPNGEGVDNDELGPKDELVPNVGPKDEVVHEIVPQERSPRTPF